ncbi:MAG: amidohydrolase, partial [Clostridiales bacterium]|nr:amidohydrolase [Clostridiales bacterium]
MTAEKLLQEAEQIRDRIVGERRILHQNAETGFDLSNTLSFVKKELTDMGIQPVDCGKAGVTALVGGKKQGKVFLLRADMDALPVREEADVPFASQNGKMHACGHDLHTAMLLGAARLLKVHEDEIEGTVKLMFQPAEELLEGAKDMVEAGVLENPHVDAALMIHVMAGMPFEPGTVIVSGPGVSAPAADYFEIRVKGKGCHGSMPHMGIDPLTAAAHMIIALQEIHARELAM